MSYSNRIFVYGPVGLLLLIVFAYCVYWRVEAYMFAARLDRANGGELIPGVIFAFAEKNIGGFPFRLDIVLSGVTIAHRGPQGETAWRAERLALHTQTYGSGPYVLEADGLQSIAMPKGPGQPPDVLYLTPTIARASAILRGGALTRLDIDFWGVQAKDATLDAAPDRTFTAARAQVHFLGQPDKSIAVAGKLEQAMIGKGYESTLAPAITLATLSGRLTQGDALTALRRGEDSVFGGLEKWRGAKGTLAVDDLVLERPGMKTDFKGALTLDAVHALTGTLTAPDAQLAFAHGDVRLEQAPAPQ